MLALNASYESAHLVGEAYSARAEGYCTILSCGRMCCSRRET